MAVIYRQKRPSDLSKEQLAKKVAKDAEYEIAHLALVTDLNQGKTTQTEFETASKKTWDDYYVWAIANDLYEEIDEQKQLDEKMKGLNMILGEVNALRTELGLSQIEVK
jgi:hypothetical protein